MTRIFFLLTLFLAAFCMIGDLCLASPLTVGSAAITTVAKRSYSANHRARVQPQTLSHRSSAKKLTVAGKKRPSAIRTTSARTSAILSPTKLRRKLSSRSAIIMDAETGQVLYAHKPDRPAQPASTIKVLTGLIAMKSLRDGTKVKVSNKASRMPRSKIYLRKGKQYAADDLINAVLLSSANDASVALAEKVAGSERTFAKLMTHKAKQLGARSTVCKTATGLTSRGQRSTVRDLATIFSSAMRDEEFASRVRKSRVRTRYGGTLSNHNKAMWQIKGAVGGKTGYTHAARQTYVGQFARGNDEITVAIMGSETMWDDISRLVEHGFARKRVLAAAQQKDRQDQLVLAKHQDDQQQKFTSVAQVASLSRQNSATARASLVSRPFSSSSSASVLSSIYKRAIF